jgi:hypothetical protein
MVVGCAYLFLHVLPWAGISIFGRSARSLPLLGGIEWSLRYLRSNNRAIPCRPPLGRQFESIAPGFLP